MTIAKLIARKVLFPLVVGLGIEKYFRSKKPQLLNVMYHGVSTTDTSYFSFRHLQKDQFEKHMIYFQKNFDVIPLHKAFDIYQNGGKLKRHTITISFDDGFENNLVLALPILKKYNMPATIFVSTIAIDPINPDHLWAEYVAALGYFYKDKEISLDKWVFVNGIDNSKGKTLIELLKTCSTSEREKFLQELEMKYQLKDKIESLPDELWNLMSVEQLKLANGGLISIQSHSHRHYNLGNIAIKEAVEDLQTSKTLLEQALERSVDILAFPDGSYSSEVKDAAEECGFKYQLAVNYREKNDPDDKRIMCRHGISTGTTFESNMFFLNRAFNTKGIKIE